MVDISEGVQDAGPDTGGARSRGPVVVTAVATLTALLLGLHHLGRRSLWYDELQTVGTVDRPLGDALWRISHWEVNQSPYHLLVTGWIRLGDSEAFLRFLSVAAWVGTVPLLFVLGRRLFDARVGALAAVLFAVHGFALEWAQQLRAYSLAACTVTLATLLLVRLIEVPTARRGVAYGLVAAVAAYTHFFALLVIGAHAVTVLVTRPRGRDRRAFFVAGGTLLAALAPLGLFLVTRNGDPVYWIEGPSRSQLVETLTDVSGGGGLQLVMYAVAGGLGLVAAARAVRDRGWTASWRPLLPVLWVVLPLAVTMLSSATVKPLLVPRFLLVVVPGLVLLAALGLVHLADHASRAAAAVALAALLVVSLLGVRDTVDRPPFEDWRGAVGAIADQSSPGDVVVTSPPRAVHAVRYYADHHDAPELALPGPDDLGDLSSEKVWVLSRRRVPSEPNRRELFEQALLEDFQLTEELVFDGIDLRRYERR